MELSEQEIQRRESLKKLRDVDTLADLSHFDFLSR